MDLSVGGFWGKETVEAGCTAYSSCKHFLISLVRIKGLQLSDLLLITQTQARHTRSSVSVRAVPGWAVLSTCPQEAHTQRKELNQLRQTHRVLGAEASTTASRLEWPILPGPSSQDLSHSTPKSLWLRQQRPGGEEHSVPLVE